MYLYVLYTSARLSFYFIVENYPETQLITPYPPNYSNQGYWFYWPYKYETNLIIA